MTGRIIIMSEKEAKQVAILEKLASKVISQKGGAVALELSPRQVRRKLKRYLEQGAKGLVHKSRGQPSNRAYDPEVKKTVLDLARTKYAGFGPVFMAEKLLELDGIKINHETLRLFLIVDGLWKKSRKTGKQRKMRERKDFYGELVQADVSFHLWIAGSGIEWALVTFIDDATSTILWLEFVNAESTQGVGGAFRRYIEQYGAPVSLYLDNHSTYKVNTGNPDGEKITQFARMAEQVGTKLIHAQSPQAKGRVERSFKTHQDRLVKELTLANIKTIDEANQFLREIYIPKHNKKFAAPAKAPENLHKPVHGLELDDIFCITHERKVQNDWTIRYENRIFQIESSRPSIIRPRDTVTVHERFNGDVFITIRTNKLDFKEIERKSKVDVLDLDTDTICPHASMREYKETLVASCFFNKSGHF
jgi:hypothetical protein